MVGGLRKLGLDPATIKYVLVSHAHYDHVGGAAFLQDRFNARVVISEADWELLEDRWDVAQAEARHGGHGRPEAHARRHHADAALHARSHARHDLDADSGSRRRACRTSPPTGAAPRSTGSANRAAYITPERPDSFWFDRYIDSAQHFRSWPPQRRRRRDAVQPHDVRRLEDEAAGAWPRASPAIRTPTSSAPEAVARYLTVAEECAKAGKLRVR